MARPKLRTFNEAHFASIVLSSLSVTSLDESTGDLILGALLPSAKLTLDDHANLLYQGRAIAHSNATYKVVANALRVEMNNRNVQVKRIQSSLSSLRSHPRPVDAIKKLDELITVYRHIISYLTSVIEMKE